MLPELSDYHASIGRRLRNVADALDGLTPAEVNSGAGEGGANSPWVLAEHTLGNARAWIFGIACGREHHRDRAAEFASSGTDVRAFRAAVEAFLAEEQVAFDAGEAGDLDRRITPAAELWGEGDPHEISVREAIIRVIEHASLHLGHLDAARDLALAARPRAAHA
ncbi:MAG: DUF664 domain-containing protein [Chloroflexi bacterium]|nr:DUF664 domain-containing protein [Chloroflexota bacterium]